MIEIIEQNFSLAYSLLQITRIGLALTIHFFGQHSRFMFKPISAPNNATVKTKRKLVDGDGFVNNRRNQTRYVTVVTKHLFFVIHRPRSDGTRNYNRYMTKL